MPSSADLVFLLHDVARLMRIEADKRARAYGSTRAQWALLASLDRFPGLSQKELAERLEVEPITVARMVDRLEARGLVERRPDPRDRRVWRLHLTDAAAPLLDGFGRLRAEMLALLSSGIPPATLAVMADGLAAMKDTLCQGRRADPRDDADGPDAAVPLPAQPAPLHALKELA